MSTTQTQLRKMAFNAVDRTLGELVKYDGLPRKTAKKMMRRLKELYLKGVWDGAYAAYGGAGDVMRAAERAKD